MMDRWLINGLVCRHNLLKLHTASGIERYVKGEKTMEFKLMLTLKTKSFEPPNKKGVMKRWWKQG